MARKIVPAEDSIGKMYGSLLVLSVAKGKNSSATYKCICGKIATASLSNIRTGNTTSCGCKKRSALEEFKTPGRAVGKWTVLGAYRRGSILCRCECGVEKYVRLDHLGNGESLSCGCWRESHGLTGTTEWIIWCDMKARCCNPNSQGYNKYGAKGIKMCDRWKDSFSAFLKDVGNRPSKEHTLDRWPNQRGDYEIGNVRWATWKEQQRNRKNNLWLEVKGVSKVASAWAEELGIDRNVIYRRLKSGWTVEDAVLKKVAFRTKRK